MEEIYLKQITKSHKSAFIKVSDRLGKEEVKLNCQDVSSLKPKQINWLLDRIPADWQNTEELYRFIDINTLESGLRKQLLHRLNSPSSKAKAYSFTSKSVLTLIPTALLFLGVFGLVLFVYFRF